VFQAESDPLRTFPKRSFFTGVVTGYIPITQQSECFADTFPRSE